MASVKSVIGTCQALGVLIESKDPKEVLEEIAEGKYKEEIEAQKTDIDPEKQEAIKKAEEAEKAAEEEAKAEAATSETPTEEKPEEKPEEKKE